MQIITIESRSQGKTTVKVVKETAKAILLAGNASEAWFPKSALSEDNYIADWFNFSLEHWFLFQAPYTEEAKL